MTGSMGGSSGGSGGGGGRGWPGTGAGASRPDGRGGFGEVRPPGAAQRPVPAEPGAYARQQREQRQGGGATTSEARRPAAEAPAPVEVPAPALPKGGGAIRSMAEKFSANPATGTGSMAVPLPLPPGRSGFGPQLSLSYGSGAGNGSWGLGWQLGVPAITRKTDKGLPQYRDTEHSDTFVLSGVEDLVPLLVDDLVEGWKHDIIEASEDPDQVRRERYRPRVEAELARIERCSKAGNVWWETVTSGNVRSIFGKAESARIADPADGRRVFSWLLEQTRDDRKNVILYEHEAEDLTNVPNSLSETHRHAVFDEAAKHLFANRYLKRILYGNKVGVEAPASAGDFHFEVVFDYGEHAAGAPAPDDSAPWPVRQDPFSSYRAGFEVRTYRLCRRVLVFHRFGAGAPLLTRSTDFTYDEGPAFTHLTRVTQKGYVDDGEGGYDEASLPAVDFTYTSAALSSAVQKLDAESAQGLASAIDGRAYQWVDLDGEGISGVLTEQAGALYYKRNLGQGKLARWQALRSQPTAPRLSARQLVDVTGDGVPDLVELGGTLPGFHPRRDDETFGALHPFRLLPNIDFSSPSLRFIDLDGDGFADVMLSEDHCYTWYPSLRERGYGPAMRGRKWLDERKGPTVVFAEAEQTVFLADMSGDGLQDLVRVRNGSVCYWPNLGYGKFGRMVVMEGTAPLAPSNHYSPSRVRLADLDGTGTADLIYIGADGVSVWMNQAGNGFAAKQQLAVFPDHSALSTVDLVDMLGTGTSCLVWSTPLRGMPPQVRYVDLLSSTKPHLLATVTNNLGLTTSITYAPSTKYYLEDKAAGVEWATRLPFPVQVVEKVEHHDAVSTLRLVTTYRYRHGFYDAEEREFRGFGYTEVRDAEHVSEDLGKGTFPSQPTVGEELVLPPVVTKTWWQTGAWQKQGTLFDAFEEEWFDAGGSEPRLTMPPLEASFRLSPPELHQAHRTLAGKMLRQEVYAEDGDPNAGKPYVVTQQSHGVRALQPAGTAPYAAFLSLPAETLTVQYERSTTNPRIAHEVTIEVDDLGYVTKAASIGYGHPGEASYLEQERTWVLMSEQSTLRELDELSWYRHGVPYEAKTWEVNADFTPAGAIFTRAELTGLWALTEVDYDVTPAEGERRLLSWTRIQYWQDYDEETVDPEALSFGQLESLALPYQSYAKALTAGMLTGALGGEVSSGVVTAEGGYVELDEDGDYWAPMGTQHFDAAAFYLVDEVTDVFGNVTAIDYDDEKLFVTKVTDPFLNETTAEHDYRVLAPTRMVDPNGNVAEVAFDDLGRVVATAVSDGVSAGDTLAEPTTKLTYELHRYATSGLPARVKTEARETHCDSETRWLVSYGYSDGMGNEVMTKVLAEAGDAPVIVEDELVYEPADPRWVGTGRTVFDNKGNPIKQYEPYFSATEEYEDDAGIVEWGVTPLLKYDPLGRLIQTLFPDQSEVRVDFTPWEQVAFDQNDTLLTTSHPWYVAHDEAPSGSPVVAPRDKAYSHRNTPATTYFDGLGRPVVVVEDNTLDDDETRILYETKSTLDIQGNLVSLEDGNGNTALTVVYGMLGQVLKQTSNDAGSRWSFTSVLGEPVRAWGERGFTTRMEYDALRRPTHVFVHDGTSEHLTQRMYYGEDHTSPSGNVLGQLTHHFDQAGVVITEDFDFKGNSLSQTRHLASDYTSIVDWSALDEEAVEDALTTAGSDLETETFVHAYEYDALNRPTSVTTPDGSEVVPTYNDAGLLETVSGTVGGAAASFVTNIDYDEKGRRTLIEYANGTETTYTYDPLTFRLTHFKTEKLSTGQLLQSLEYHYDAVGNIVETKDTSTHALYFGETTMAASADGAFTYDALYRLIKAYGREHASGADVQRDEVGLPIHAIPHPNDPSGLRRYRQTYSYDAVGNILQMRHWVPPHGTQTYGWTRDYTYTSGTNRLATTTHPGGTLTYSHDAHGNMDDMPHLEGVEWDFADQLRMVEKQSGGGQPVYFVYDASGQRVRKVYEHSGLREERIYLGGYEVYRKTTISGETLEVERQTLHIADDARRVCMVETLTVDEGEEVEEPEPRYRFQLDNHLGTACVEVDDDDGGIISYEEYHPYGTSAYRSFGSSDVSAKRYRYTGKERDEETGLYYHGARYYMCWLARWASADPLGVGADGPGLYTYVRGSPLVLSDPSGMGPEAAAALMNAAASMLLAANDSPADLAKSLRVSAVDLMNKAAALAVSASHVDPAYPDAKYGWLAGQVSSSEDAYRPSTASELGVTHHVPNPIDARTVPALRTIGAAAKGVVHAVTHPSATIDATAAAAVEVAAFLGDSIAAATSGGSNESAVGGLEQNKVTQTLVGAANTVAAAAQGNPEAQGEIIGMVVVAGVAWEFSRMAMTGEPGALGGRRVLREGVKDRAIEKAVKFAQKNPKEGFFDFIAHGDAFTVFGETGEALTATEVAGIIRSSPGWRGQNVRMIVCEAGKCATGMAQQVADELGVVVEGATTQFAPTGSGSIVFDPGGKWVSFSPQKK